MNLIESIKNNLEESKLSREELKNIYLMDRVLRSMNDENALSDGWLMNYVADEDSDNGVEYIIQEYGDFLTKEDYESAYRYYKELVNEYKDGGIISREFYKNDPNGNWKWNAGANEEEIAFVKKDFPDIEVITK